MQVRLAAGAAWPQVTWDSLSDIAETVSADGVLVAKFDLLPDWHQTNAALLYLLNNHEKDNLVGKYDRVLSAFR